MRTKLFTAVLGLAMLSIIWLAGCSQQTVVMPDQNSGSELGYRILRYRLMQVQADPDKTAAAVRLQKHALLQPWSIKAADDMAKHLLDGDLDKFIAVMKDMREDRKFCGPQELHSQFAVTFQLLNTALRDAGSPYRFVHHSREDDLVVVQLNAGQVHGSFITLRSDGEPDRDGGDSDAQAPRHNPPPVDRYKVFADIGANVLEHVLMSDRLKR